MLGLARLPLSVLHVVADGFYLLMRYGLRYRQKVVLQNLRNSFPERSEAEIRQISAGFYRHFADVIVEILKLAAISPAELRRRVQIRNAELFTEQFGAGRTVLALGSHIGNWEWILPTGAVTFPDKAHGVYKPLSNPFFEHFMLRLRTRTGAHLIPMRDTLRDMLRRRGQPRSLSMLSDQSPASPEQTYWTTFLHQETAFYTGADKLAAQFHCPVLYVNIVRQRRGYYEISVEQLHDGTAPLDKDAHAITEAFARCVERDIRARPADYLWSHRRWKLKRAA
ncbi:lauroyl acyltransferase [Hymenobacter busanensis]|uniref:Lauroyl acyltransferase n=1 Tax=Hymenobacter busanensis TaxID=2607656 RepID=A0A7L5A5A7_9BACT|nr:lauroyl acyltransferase [Hymenobacter busanensis]QHJ09650.1 lauroyl acyltransferase [Hymenobacter busanensis]